MMDQRKPLNGTPFEELKQYVSELEESTRKLKRELVIYKAAEVLQNLPDSKNAVWKAVTLIAGQDQPMCPLCNTRGKHTQECIVPRAQALLNKKRRLSQWKLL